MPLMNISGNLISEESIMMLLGVLLGAEEKMSPIEEKQNADRMIPNRRINRLEMAIPRAKPIITGIREIKVPKTKEARMSPRTIVGMVTGQDISLSNVLACVSQGATTGDMAVEVKKSTIPRSPGITKGKVRFLPIINERKRKTGNIMPNIITGPLR